MPGTSEYLQLPTGINAEDRLRKIYGPPNPAQKPARVEESELYWDAKELLDALTKAGESASRRPNYAAQSPSARSQFFGYSPTLKPLQIILMNVLDLRLLTIGPPDAYYDIRPPDKNMRKRYARQIYDEVRNLCEHKCPSGPETLP